MGIVNIQTGSRSQTAALQATGMLRLCGCLESGKVPCKKIKDVGVIQFSTIKPLEFKIAASWASHEGSILLWLCLLQIMGFIYLLLFNNRPNRLYHIIILSLIQILFGSFIYLTSNPFDRLSFTPTQGLGLNPMLQDIALIIHPPILYLGYVSYVIPFACACTALFTSKIEFADLKEIKIFTNLGMIFLQSLKGGLLRIMS